MSSSSEVSDPMAIMSDDEMLSEQEVYTSDTTSTDDDDFQPFALPDVGVEPADGLPAGDLPLAVIPAPVPLAADPVVDMPLDVVSDDDVDLFEDDPLQDEALVAAGDIPLHAGVPAREAPVHSPVPDSFESVASTHASAHSVESDHEVDSDPVFPPGFGPDHDLPVVAPFAVDIPVDPVVAPFPDPVPVMFDRALFEAHVDPRDADTHNGWIQDDDDFPPFVVPVTPVSAPASAPFDVPLFPTHTADAHRTDLPITFLQVIPPPRPGEGLSHQPFGHAPFQTGGDQFAPQIPHHTADPPVPPFAIPPFAPSSDPFLWTSPPIMPPTDPYHPFYVGPSTEDVLVSFMIQHDAMTRRVQVLEQQIACLLRSHRAMEEDWLLMRRLFYSHFPPPPPPSA